MIDCDAYILIGGRSSRFGRDKAMVEFDGKTLAQRAYATVSTALPDSRTTFVAANEAQFAIAAALAGGRFIFDLIPDRGPLSGLHAALADTQKPWIFVLACDYPFMTVEFVRFLANNVTDDHGSVVPEQPDGRLQPLCAFYKKSIAASLIEEMIQRPRATPSMHDVVSQLDPLIVKPSEYGHLDGSADMFSNINTPLELNMAREIKRKLLPGK
jgi:molybdopterin-guanine dinucleotide biosynthesis protein A